MNAEIIRTVKNLLLTDYAFSLSYITTITSFYVIILNLKTAKFFEVYLMAIGCLLYSTSYQIGSIRWAFYEYNSNLKSFDFYYWTILDLFLQCLFIGILLCLGRIVVALHERGTHD